jgi:ATP-dependent Clp protease ATP-binding subunit ClpA
MQADPGQRGRKCRALARDVFRSSTEALRPAPSPRLRSRLDTAQSEAERLKDDFVSTEHLLLGIASEEGRAQRRSSMLSSTE